MRADARPVVALSSVALLGTVIFAQPQPPPTQAQVDRIFSRWTQTTPGCAVGADVKGEPVIRAAYGMADLERDVPITAGTIFEAGSIAKQFTAAAVLLLERDGKLNLDDPLRRYVPELPDYGTPVTIRQALHHTAGLRDWGYLTAVAGWPRGTRVHTFEHVLDILSRQRALNFPPGTYWSYSNSGYSLMPILVSRVSGVSFSEFTRTRIFEPLGMKDTSWRDDWTRLVKGRALGYAESQGTFRSDVPIENVHGNGGLLTTVGDLLKWNANFDRPVVGDASFVAELQRPAVLSGGRVHEYALGLYVDTYKGAREVDHSGGGLGYVSHLARYPEQQVSVAVLCNVGSANATRAAKSVAELFLTDLRPAPPPTASHTLTGAEGARLVGLYRSTQPRDAATVLSDENGLRIQYRYGSRLVARSPTHFVAPDGIRYEFEAAGQMRTIDEFGTVTIYERVEPANMSVARLKEYAGSYVSDEAEVTLSVALEGDQLSLRRRPDPLMVLTPVYEDAFSMGSVWIIFRRGPSGRVEGFSLSGDRMWDLPFVRHTQPAAARHGRQVVSVTR